MSKSSDALARKRADRRFWFLAAVGGLLLLGVVAAVEEGGDQPNNEPYTGLCNRPTPQGGC